MSNETSGKVESIFSDSDFKVIADNHGKEIEVGLIMGYDSDGDFIIYSGGLLDGNKPAQKDWLWMIETLKRNLLDGVYV